MFEVQLNQVQYKMTSLSLLGLIILSTSLDLPDNVIIYIYLYELLTQKDRTERLWAYWLIGLGFCEYVPKSLQ